MSGTTRSTKARGAERSCSPVSCQLKNFFYWPPVGRSPDVSSRSSPSSSSSANQALNPTLHPHSPNSPRSAPTPSPLSAPTAGRLSRCTSIQPARPKFPEARLPSKICMPAVRPNSATEAAAKPRQLFPIQRPSHLLSAPEFSLCRERVLVGRAGWWPAHRVALLGGMHGFCTGIEDSYGNRGRAG